MFVRENILDPLSTALSAILQDESNYKSAITDLNRSDPDIASPLQRCLEIMLLFAQVAQSDVRVRNSFAERSVLKRWLIRDQC
jgi:hypothetical protein